MMKRAGLFPVVWCVVALSCVAAFGQAAVRPQTGATAQQEQTPQTAAVSAADPLANELALLRKAVQTLNARLREISEKLFETDAAGTLGPSNAPGGKQGPLAQSMDILTRAEQRAEIMRRQLLEMIEKETAYRNRLVQLDEDMRPENIDRSLTLVGTTRTSDLRETRRRVLDNERKGVESILNQTSASRARLEEDLKQADLLVARIRQKLLPLIEREFDKLPSND